MSQIPDNRQSSRRQKVTPCFLTPPYGKDHTGVMQEGTGESSIFPRYVFFLFFFVDAGKAAAPRPLSAPREKPAKKNRQRILADFSFPDVS
jgi:hypothetical protein